LRLLSLLSLSLLHVGQGLTCYPNLTEKGRNVPGRNAVGKRNWSTFKPKDTDVQNAKKVVVNSFISLADPHDFNSTKVTCAPGAQRMGMLTQSVSAQKQVVHRDGHYYSSMVSRHSSTTLLMYVRHEGQLVEFQMRIPPGYIIFWEGNVNHAGDVYPEKVPEGKERIFCYVHGYDPKGYPVTSEGLDMSKEEMCAQQGIEPEERTLYQTLKERVDQCIMNIRSNGE